MALVSQLAQSASLTTGSGVALTGEDDATGAVNKALAVLTRYFPTELVAPYAAITASLPEIKPSSAVVTRFAEMTPPVAAESIPRCEHYFDGRWAWFVAFGVLALVLVPALNATRDTPAKWKIVLWIDAPIALSAFLLWGLALPNSPLESVCGDQADTIQIACAVLGGLMVPIAAAALKNTLGKKWAT